MKYIATLLLLCFFAAPAMSQGRQHRENWRDRYNAAQTETKSCSHCAAKDKVIAGLRKRLEEATKERGKAGKRGRGRSDRSRDARSESRRGSRGDRGHGRWTPRSNERKGGQKTVPSKRKDVDVDALRKKWREQLQKRYGGRIAVS